MQQDIGGQDTGAVANKGCKYVTGRGNQNIMFTIITPEKRKLMVSV